LYLRGKLFLGRRLRIDTQRGLLVGQAARLHEALDLLLTGRRNHPDGVTQALHVGLQQLDGFHHDDPRIRSGQESERFTNHRGVDDLLEVAQRLGVGEHQRAKAGAVYLAIGTKDIRTEAGHDAAMRLGAGAHYIVRERIRVDHLGSQHAQHGRYGALAGAMFPVKPMTYMSALPVVDSGQVLPGLQLLPNWASNCRYSRPNA